MKTITKGTIDAKLNEASPSAFIKESKTSYQKEINSNNITNLDINQEVKSIPAHDKISSLFPYYLSKPIILTSFLDKDRTIILQRMLRISNSETISFIVKELKGTYKDIIRDKNGNYFFSDLIKLCEMNDRILILDELSPIISELCLNSFASFSIQALIERVSSEIEYKYILNYFYDYNKFLTASLDPNGAYTVKKIIERIPNRFRTYFNYIFISFLDFISKTKFGIVTVKKFISYTKDENTISQIMNSIRKNFMNFAVGQYSNYLIQFLLEKWINTPEGNEIKELIFDNFHEMCMKKYSSFICEIFAKMISKEEKIKLINSFDWQYILRSNNRHLIKILNALNIQTNENNNFMLPCNLNKNFVKSKSI